MIKTLIPFILTIDLVRSCFNFKPYCIHNTFDTIILHDKLKFVNEKFENIKCVRALRKTERNSVNLICFFL